MIQETYSHGSSLYYDRTGELTDQALNIAERYGNAGKAWRLSLPRSVLGADGIYATLSFITPADDFSFYQFAQTQKDGAEVSVTLVEEGTYAGGSNVTGELLPWRLNRIYGDTGCPFTNIQTGISPTATITGGRVAPSYLMPGTSQGNSNPGVNGGVPTFVVLKPDTRYTFRMTAIGGAATVSAILTVATDKRY